MSLPPQLCVLIPVYNHGLTVGGVAASARRFFPVIVVDDGSTDQTAEALARLSDIEVVHLPQNQGKAAALQTGFAKARELGFTHAITLDADGQHPAAAVGAFAAASRRNPEALIVGVRNLKAAGAPLARRFSNGLSTFWFRFEAGARLEDTQCGYRVYPLERVRALRVSSTGYAWELEIMVKAAWAGIALLAQPVEADYAAPTSRLSHFRPYRDFIAISRVHSRLSVQTFCLPVPLRKLLAEGVFHDLPRRHKLRVVLGHLYSEHTESAGRLASAVGVGLFCGIAPIWGAQMLAAALLAHKLRLNKAIALTASNISFPLAAPFIMAAALVLGHFLCTGEWLCFNARLAAAKVPLYLFEWFVGSIVLGLMVGLLGAGLTLLAARVFGGGSKS